jgi:hypothetical protein
VITLYATFVAIIKNFLSPLCLKLLIAMPDPSCAGSHLYRFNLLSLYQQTYAYLFTLEAKLSLYL